MPYIDDEISNIDGQPNELYKFEGAFESYFYTTGPVAVSFLGDNYLPITMERSEVSAGTQSDDNLSISVDLPISVTLVQRYAFQIAPPSLRLTIYRYHDIGEYVSYWQGLVGQIKVSNGRAVLRSPSVLEFALSGSVPSVFYQTVCNHVLFDERCQVAELLWSQAATVDAISGRTLTLSTIGTLNGVLVGGTARLASGETRMIVAQSGSDITVNFGFSEVTLTDAITIFAGCNHDTDCVGRFNNGINYGGMRYIPPENVFDQGIEPGNLVLTDNTCFPDINLGFENGDLSGWSFSGAGISVRTATPNGNAPQEGTYLVDAGDNAFSSMWRTLNVSKAIYGLVDAGLVSCTGFSCYHETYDIQVDQGRLFMEFRNAAGAVISTSTTPYLHPNTWLLRTIAGEVLPAGTRSIRWGVNSDRIEGSVNDNYWDNFTALELII